MSDFILPSPSSLMDFGWETAKHCIVSYFWCASWLSWPSSSDSGKGFTSIRQLNVWLLRLGGSPDQDPPFTEQGKEIRNYKETNVRLTTAKLSKYTGSIESFYFYITLIVFYCNFIIWRGNILGWMFQLGKIQGIFRMSFYPSLQVQILTIY